IVNDLLALGLPPAYDTTCFLRGQAPNEFRGPLDVSHQQPALDSFNLQGGLLRTGHIQISRGHGFGMVKGETMLPDSNLIAIGQCARMSYPTDIEVCAVGDV